MTVRRKLVLGFSLMMVLVAIFSFIVVYYYMNLGRQFHTLDRDILLNTDFLVDVDYSADGAYQETMYYVFHDKEKSRISALDGIQRLREIEDELQLQLDDTRHDDYGKTREFVSALARFRIGLETMMSVKDRGNSLDTLVYTDRLTSLPALLALRQNIHEQKAAYNDELDAVRADFHRTYESGLHFMWLCVGLIALISVVAGIYITRSITGPLETLRTGTEMVAKGRLDYRVGTSAKDEIGQLSRAFDNMTQSLSTSTTSIDNLNREITERRKIVKALAERDRTLRLISEASVDIIMILDTKLNLTFVNRHIHGENKQSIVGQAMSTLLTDNEWKESKPYLEQAIETRTPVNFESVYTYPDGGAVNLESIASPIIVDGVVEGLVVTSRDITRRKKTMMVLQEERKRAQNYLDIAGTMLLALDLDGNVTLINKAGCEILELDEANIIGKNWFDSFLPEDIREDIRGIFQHVVHDNIEGYGTNAGHSVITGGGREKTIAWRHSIVRDEKGAIVGVLSSGEDVTGRLMAEKALKESEEKFSRAFSASPAAIAITAVKDARYMEVNDTYTKIIGYSREELIGRTAIEVGIWNKEEDPSWLFDMLKKKGTVRDEEIEFRTKSGEALTWLLSAEIISINDEECIIGVATDISERKKRMQLQDAENRVLTLLGQGVELEDLLDAIIRLGEEQDTTIKGSVMLYDAANNLLSHGASPSLPEEYVALLKKGIPTGPVAGACGTAAYRKKRIIITDIANTPLFEPYKKAIAVATGNGLRACSSQPIIASNGVLLGTIANYSNKVGKPTADNLRVLEWSAHIAAIAIERKRAENALRENEERFRLLAENSTDLIMKLKIQPDPEVEYVSPSLFNMLGYTAEELMADPSINLRTVHPDDRDALFAAQRLERGSIGRLIYRRLHRDGRIVWVDESYTVIVDENGVPESLQIVSHDISEQKKSQELQAGENYVLTLLGKGVALNGVLDAIVRMGEKQDFTIKGSIMLYDASENRLVYGAAPSIPGEHVAMLKAGVPVGPNAGVCGAAAYRKERIIVTDIANSPFLFSNREFIDVATGNGIHACCSQPIIASNGELLGTIANYGDKVAEPTADSLGVLEWSARIAAIAIEWKRADDALRESEEFSSSLLDNAGTQVVVINPDTSIRYVNRSWEELNGWRLAEVIGMKAPYPWWPEESREESMAGFKEIFREKKAGSGEIVAQKRNGKYYWIEMNWVPVLRDGEIDYLLVTALEVTQRKEMEKALQESEEKYRRVIETSKDTILIVNTKGNIQFANNAVVELTGYSVEESYGMSLRDFVLPEYWSAAYMKFRQAKNGKVISHFETVIKRKDGRIVCVEVAGHAILIDGKVTGVQVVARDISERKRMENELKAHRDHLEELVHERTAALTTVNAQLQDELTEREKIEQALRKAKDDADIANRAKSEFVARMSHEIRTPIHGVMGTLDLVLDNKLEREQRQYLGMARSSAETLLGVINDILDFSKIEAGKLEMECIDFDLQDTLDEALETMAVPAFKKGLELTGHIGQKVPAVLAGDSGRLRQVLINLLSNAIKFTGHGEVALRVEMEAAEKKKAALHFTVRDTGIGIPDDKQALIFDTFQQVDGSVRRNYGGTGLGLTICRQLVESMGGKIWVESASGEGSIFHFTAVFARPSSKKLSAARRRVMPELKGVPVLIVDDNATSRMVLREILTGWGLEVTEAANGMTALQELGKVKGTPGHFRIMLLDKKMPEINGFTIAEQVLQDADMQTGIVMMLSPENVSDDFSHCQEMGIPAHVVKPVKASQLHDALLRAVGLARDVQEDAREVIPAASRELQLRVLVAEDNATAQLIARKTLEKMGHTVTIANNGLEEVRMFSEGDFDLILTDVEMPIMDGFEAARRIRSREISPGHHIPIVAMTAYAMKEDREKCLEAGMDGYLSKPVKPDELYAVLKELFPHGKGQASAPVPAPVAVTATTVKEVQKTEPAVDMNAAMEVFGGDEELFREAAGLFLEEDYPEQHRLLREAVEKQDAPAVKAAAHSIKGAARSMGGLVLGEIAFRLETLGRNGDLAGAGELMGQMEAERKRFADFFTGRST